MHPPKTTYFAEFPYLGRASVAPLEAPEAAERIPPFVALLVKAFDAHQSGALCFILPKLGDLARLVAVVYGTHRFRSGQLELLREYGERTIPVGARVRIHPGKHVFIYRGFDPTNPGIIRLSPLNGGPRDWWGLNAAEILLRLETTTLSRPIGKMNTPVHNPEPPPVDQLLDTWTFGNQSIFRNEVVLLDSRSGFQHFLENTKLARLESVTATPALKSLLPFGEICIAGPNCKAGLRKWDERSPTGEPLVAATSSPEVLAAFCTDALPRSKFVVVNGLGRVRDLQSFDDIARTQRVVLFAEDGEEEQISLLASRGCRLWQVTDTELNAGADVCEGGDPRFFGPLRRFAQNKAMLTLDAEFCESPSLEEVSIQVESLRNIIHDDDQGPLPPLVGRLWRVLNELAAVVRPLQASRRERFVESLQQLRKDFQGHRAWLPAEQDCLVNRCIGDLESLAASADVGVNKRAALDRLVSQCMDSKVTVAIVVRNENDLIELTEHYRRHVNTGRLTVCTPRWVDPQSSFARIICVSWPGGETMQRLAFGLNAPHITLLGYAFERRWLNQCARRLRRQPAAERMSDSEKAALLGLPPPSVPSTPTNIPAEPTSSGPSGDDGIWGFEQRLRTARKGAASTPTTASDTVLARYVSFVGSTYALMTETHRIVVISGLLRPNRQSKQRLPEVTVGELKQSDFIVFPESSDKELILEKADQLLGPDAVHLRNTARMWKQALWSSGLTPAAFLKHAKDLGRPRHPLTIRYWFADTPQMGPGTGVEDLSEDLELIALVTDYEPLKARIPEVMEAIRRLRGAHLSAGMRLRDVFIERLPAVIGRLDEEGTKVDLAELGSAWIVQVESVAPASEPRGWGEVNRLLWDREADPNTLELAF